MTTYTLKDKNGKDVAAFSATLKFDGIKATQDVSVSLKQTGYTLVNDHKQ